MHQPTGPAPGPWSPPPGAVPMPPQGPPPGPPPGPPFPPHGGPPPGPLGPPWAAPPPPPKPRVGILVLVLVLVVVGGLAGFAAFTHHLENEKSAKRAAAAKRAEEQGKQAAGKLAQQFVEHVAEGHASEAFGLMGQYRPQDSAILPDAVYAKALKATPISDVKVQKIEDRGTLHAVTVRYLAGKKEQSALLEVAKQPNGRWAVARTLPVLKIGVPKHLGATLHGHPIPKSATFVALPGTYTLRAASPLVDAGVEPVTVTLAEGAEDHELTMQARITKDGQRVIRAALEQVVAHCVSQQSLAPKGCPWVLKDRSNQHTDPASIRYQVRSPGWLNRTSIGWSSANPGMAEIHLDVQMHLSARGTVNGRAAPIAGTFRAKHYYVVDLSKKDPVLTLGS